MNCKNCGAPMRLMAERGCFFCDYCGTYSFPDETRDRVQILNETSTLKCPLCHVEQVSGLIFDFPVLVCKKCRGLMFKPPILLGVMDYVLKAGLGGGQMARPLDREGLSRMVHCPGCNQQMSTHPYQGGGNIIIDTCMPCRLVWLDYGELHRVIISNPKNPFPSDYLRFTKKGHKH